MSSHVAAGREPLRRDGNVCPRGGTRRFFGRRPCLPHDPLGSKQAGQPAGGEAWCAAAEPFHPAVAADPEGTVFYERSLRLLADLDEAESGVGASEVPSGRLRINTNVPIGRQFLLPLVPEFLALYPAVTLDIVLTDTVIDLMADRTDVAIRGGPLKSSSLVARKLGETPKIIVGSPDYLARHGRPERPADLARHNCMELGYARAIEGWHLIEDGVETVYPPVGSAQVSDGDSLRELALAGAGLARLSACIVRGDIAAGRLVPVLEAFSPGDTEPFHIVYLGQRGRLPARVRALVDFLAARIRID